MIWLSFKLFDQNFKLLTINNDILYKFTSTMIKILEITGISYIDSSIVKYMYYKLIENDHVLQFWGFNINIQKHLSE